MHEFNLPTHRRPTTPGEIIQEEFLNAMNVTQQQLADAMHVDRVRVNNIINGRRGITPDTALRLEKVLGPSAQFWLNLQQSVELWDALHSDELQGKIEHLDRLQPAQVPHHGFHDDTERKKRVV